MTTHTFGPWERRGEYLLEIREREDDAENEGEDAGWYSVATVHQPGEANARLIAAAPELLKALDELTPPDWSLNDPMSLKYGRARAAIKAAKGDA